MDNSDIYVIDPNGIKDLKSRCHDRYDFKEIYIHCSTPVLREHYIKRGQTLQEYYQRRDSEDEQFNAYEQSWSWDRFVDNDGKLDIAVENVCEYISKEMHTIFTANNHRAAPIIYTSGRRKKSE